MWLSKLPLFFKTRSVPAEFGHLRTADELRAILDRERSRADRTRTEFSLLRFTPREAATAHETLTSLARILKGRLRSTDDAGWLADQQVGVVLPDTSAQGARRLAAEVCQIFGELTPPRCEVYCYPTSALPKADDSQNGAAGHNGSNTNGSSTNGSAAHNGSAHQDEIPAGALEPLLVDPLSLVKRILDITGGMAVLALASPIILTAAVAVKLTSKGPVFFTQHRAGRGSHPFLMYKLRTMQINADAIKHQLMDQNESDGPAFKMKDDPRLTSIGKFLRRSSIDELPQLWNVIKGDMSLVGPRPLPCNESDNCAPWQRERLRVKPGLTCIWQVKGRSKLTSFDQWMRMDLNYVQDASLITDLKILVATVPAVVFGKGAY